MSYLNKKLMTYKNTARCPACLSELVITGKKRTPFGEVIEAKCLYCGFVTLFSNVLKNGPNAAEENATKGKDRT